MLDAKECREHAMNCIKQAAEATDRSYSSAFPKRPKGGRAARVDLAKLEEKLAQELQAA